MAAYIRGRVDSTEIYDQKMDVVPVVTRSLDVYACPFGPTEIYY